jgi:NAD(P)-dependent dehydrogenase (short-subunit alcohol dehydrogenase family)
VKKFATKVAAITGAGSGIGRALALDLASRNCQLALSDINEEGLEETATLATARGVRVTSHKVDVADRHAVHRWADQVVTDHGSVNFIFNNAGVAMGSTIEGMSYEDFEWLLNINFWGVVYGTKAFLPHLKMSGDGHIVNVSSIFGLAGIPTQGAYNAAKFAVRGFTECLRQELDMTSCGVSATSVHPGGIKTSIARSARMNSNIGDLGMDTQSSHEKFEKAFITSPEKAARTILRAVQKNQRRVLVGPDAHVYDWMVRLLPSRYQDVSRRFAKLAMR